MTKYISVYQLNDVFKVKFEGGLKQIHSDVAEFTLMRLTQIYFNWLMASNGYFVDSN